MLQKNIEFKSHKAESHDVKKITSSQHSKMKKKMADQLRGEIKKLIEKQDYALQQKWKCYEEYQKLKAKGEEKDAQFYYKSYRTWSDEAQGCGEKSIVKLRAVQKYEQPRNMYELNMEELKIREKQQYMKYGPSDEEI